MFWRHEQLLRNITPGAGGALDVAVAEATHGILMAAAAKSPVWYGVLQAAHRGEAEGAKGRVFIASGITHPLGGQPHKYGPEVHQRKPWFSWTLEQDAPAILESTVAELEAKIVTDWQQGALI